MTDKLFALVFVLEFLKTVLGFSVHRTTSPSNVIPVGSQASWLALDDPVKIQASVKSFSSSRGNVFPLKATKYGFEYLNYPVGVTLKIAVDATGGVAELDTEESERFTSPASLDMVHRLRRDSDAVLVGRGTVQADNPSLLIRRVDPIGDKQPLRVILDPKLSIALEQFSTGRAYQIFEDGYPTVVYHTMPDVDPETLAFVDTVQLVQLPTVSREHNEKIPISPVAAAFDDESSNSAVVAPPPKVSNPMLSVTNVMSDLSQRFRVKHLMVEGGPTTALSFLKAGVVDRAIVVKAPVRFRQPLPSGITRKLLQDAGLKLLGTYESESDVIECWSRPNLPWPTGDIHSWP